MNCPRSIKCYRWIKQRRVLSTGRVKAMMGSIQLGQVSQVYVRLTFIVKVAAPLPCGVHRVQG